MHSPFDTFDALKHAFDDAWSDVQALFGARVDDAESLRLDLARRIVKAANDGERDPAQLKLIALQAIDA
jgi:hypothetical protein